MQVENNWEYIQFWQKLRISSVCGASILVRSVNLLQYHVHIPTRCPPFTTVSLPFTMETHPATHPIFPLTSSLELSCFAKTWLASNSWSCWLWKYTSTATGLSGSSFWKSLLWRCLDLKVKHSSYIRLYVWTSRSCTATGLSCSSIWKSLSWRSLDLKVMQSSYIRLYVWISRSCSKTCSHMHG